MAFSENTAGHTLAELTEATVLARIFPRLPSSDEATVGPGDDCAVLRADGSDTVVTSDMMVHGPDFRCAWSTPFDVGWKAAATNLADVAAMGARPTALVVALAVPNAMSIEALEGFTDGMREACQTLAPGCGVVGGDLSVSTTATVAVTALGTLEGRLPVLRSGANDGDTVALAGRLGDAARGLDLLFREGTDENGEPDSIRARALRAQHPDLVLAQVRPVPPIDLGPVAARAGASAMMDVSDGLSLDATRLADASDVTIDLDAERLGADPSTALSGGEDHGLLACFPAQVSLPAGFSPIGRVRSREGNALLIDGAAMEPSGWDPYVQWDGRTG